MRNTSAYPLMARIAAAGPVEGWEGQAGAERTRTYRLRPAKACRSLPGPAKACQGLPGPARAGQGLPEPERKPGVKETLESKKEIIENWKKTETRKKPEPDSHLKREQNVKKVRNSGC